MADFTALGARATVLIKFPPQVAADIVPRIDLQAPYKDGFSLASVNPQLIPGFRKLGAEIFVIAGNSNDFYRLTDGMDEDALTGFIDERRKQAEDDLLVASSGDKGSGGAA